MSQLPPADWYADPFGRYERRYWDGSVWTEHVATAGQPGVDAPIAAPVLPVEVPQIPAGWHPDPFRRFESRYWDGSAWTDHVATQGQQSVDAPEHHVAPPSLLPPSPATPAMPSVSQPQSFAPTPPPTNIKFASKIHKQVAKAGAAGVGGPADTSVFDESVLVINQKGKLVELRAEYAIYDQNGRQLAAVQGKRISTRMNVVDMSGRPLLEMRRDANLMSSKIGVTGADGVKLGRIVTSMHINKVDRDFKLEGPNNELVGEVLTEDKHRHRRREFRIQDPSGNLIADLSKTRAGLAKELLTKGDHYVLSFSGSPSPALRSLSVAAAIVIDTRFHQN